MRFLQRLDMRATAFLLVLLYSFLLSARAKPDTEGIENAQVDPLSKQAACSLDVCVSLLREEGVLKGKVETLSSQLNTVMSRLTDSEDQLKVLKQENMDQKNELEALRSTISLTENKLGEQQSEIENLKKFHGDEANVAFSASLRSFGSIGPKSEETTLEYSNVFTNKGNGYDSATGVFTAPVSGVYLFLFYHHALGGECAYLSLTRNGVRVVTTGHHKNVNEGSSNGSNAVTIQLDKGDQMRIRLWGGCWVFDDDKNYTTFTGILLFKCSGQNFRPVE